MIVVRDIFQLKFGKAKDAKEIMKEGEALNKKFGFDNSRVLTDLVASRSYSLILESTWENLSAWENSMKEGLSAKEWQQWYAKFVPLCESAGREILNIVEF